MTPSAGIWPALTAIAVVGAVFALLGGGLVTLWFFTQRSSTLPAAIVGGACLGLGLCLLFATVGLRWSVRRFI